MGTFLRGAHREAFEDGMTADKYRQLSMHGQTEKMRPDAAALVIGCFTVVQSSNNKLVNLLSVVNSEKVQHLSMSYCIGRYYIQSSALDFPIGGLGPLS